MGVVESEFYKTTNGKTEHTMKAYGIDDKFTVEITRDNPHFNHDYQERMSLSVLDAIKLKKQLDEFLKQNSK